MKTRLITPTPDAYAYPLLIKNLLETPLIYSPDQEIIYRDQTRYTYKTFGQRVKQLANMLTRMGVKPGDTVAVMDWDSTRYLECFFCRSHDGGGASHHQHPPDPGTAHLHH